MELEMPELEEVLRKAGGNEQLLKEQQQEIRLWLKEQERFPQDMIDDYITDQRLRYLICISRFNLEKAKKACDAYYDMRNLFPEISNFDPLGDDILQCHKCMQFIPLPKLTPKKYRLSIARLLDSDSSIFDTNAILKYGFMSLEMCVEEDIVTADVVIIDAANSSFGHILKYTPSALKKLQIGLEMYGRRVKAIHIINTSYFFGILMTALQSVLNAGILSIIHVYSYGIEELYDIIPMSILPEDYGGDLPSMDTIAEMWYAKLNERRDWYLEIEKRYLAMNPSDSTDESK